MFISWSFGILLYEMLSFGQLPYANIETTEAVIEFVNSGERLSKPEMASDNMYLILLIFIKYKYQTYFYLKLSYNDAMLVSIAVLSSDI
jgi:hypothetical protein